MEMSCLISTLGKESRMKLEDVEEFSAKVSSEIIKVGLLEAEIQRLSEANGRLRNYNGELRHALFKEQNHYQVIQIPEDGGNSELYCNKPVEEVSQTHQNVDGVVFNPIIMDLVFKNLDVKNIKKCRSICKNWNETVSRILPRQNGGYGLSVRLEERKLQGMTDALRRQTIQDLHSIVACAPQNWFSKALVNKIFTRRTDIQSVLRDFGYRLRSIEITEANFLFQDVHKILVDWCPNLEQLALPCRLSIHVVENVPYRDRDRKEGHQKLVFARPLKLTGLFMQQDLCISIVKASPNLKTLSLSCHSDKYSFRNFIELLNCPEVTRNLENVKLNTGWIGTRTNQIITLFNSIQFSSKLKKLTIEAVGEFKSKELSEALDKLGGTLVKLVIVVDNIMDPELVFPAMNTLTELRYLTNNRGPIDSIHFLTKMPNLQKCYLGEEVFGSEYFMDNLFSYCEPLRRSPRTKLKELYLFGIVRSPSLTFEMMNTFFPNLTKLVVGIFVLPHWNDWEELKNYYAAVLDGGISVMTNLKELYLDFSSPNSDDEKGFDYVAVVFNQLNKLSNLNRLTIRSNSNSTTSLDGDKLLEIPNLRQVTLIGLNLDRLAAKKLTILLDKRDIQLEIEDAEFEDDFRRTTDLPT